jgi:hypothetical protein
MPERTFIGTATLHSPVLFPMPGSTLGASVRVLVEPGDGQVFVDDVGLLTYEFVGMAEKDRQPIAGTAPVTVTSKSMDEHEFGMLVRDELRGRLDGYRTYSFALNGFLRTVSCSAGVGDDQCELHADVFTFKQETPPPIFDDGWSMAREHARNAHGVEYPGALDYGVIMRRFVSEPRAVTAYPVV